MNEAQNIRQLQSELESLVYELDEALKKKVGEDSMIYQRAKACWLTRVKNDLGIGYDVNPYDITLQTTIDEINTEHGAYE